MRRRSLRTLQAAALLVFTTANALAADGHEEAGLYVFMNHLGAEQFTSAYTAALSKDYVDGAAIVVDWNAIEPRPDVYDWALFDTWVRNALAQNKKLAVGVIAGRSTPDWLYGAGFDVPRNSFSYNRNRQAVACTVLTLPSPWAPAYLREFGKTMAALSRHLHDLPVPGRAPGAAYAAVTVVKLTGINNTSEELRLDATQPDDGPCHQSDAATIWAAAGFTPARIITAWMTIAAGTAQDFPDKILSVAIIHRNAFPSIDDSGHVTAPISDAPDPLTYKILQAGAARYGSRLMVQWNALFGGRVVQEVLDAGQAGARIGWQMNAFLGVFQGTGCIYPGFVRAPCRSAEDFQRILDNGIDHGGRYIEIHPQNTNGEFDAAFEAAHGRLVR